MAEEYRILITIEGRDQGATRSLGRVSGVLSSVAKIATGILAARLFERLAAGFVGLGREALMVTAKFERMELALQNLQARELLAANSGMTMAEALRASVGPAKELFKWSVKMAIHSPFTTEGVINVLKTSMAYGFTLKEAKKLTQVMLDFSSAVGLSDYQMRRIGYALGQVRAKGRLMGEEIRQLVNAGVPVNDILEQMGYNLRDVRRGAVDATEFIAAFTEYVDTNFAGAAERQTETWAGLLNTFHDLKELGLRNFFAGLLDVLQPLAAEFSQWMQTEGLDRLRQWGENIGLAADAVRRLIEQDWDGLLSDLRQLGAPMDKAAGLVGFLRDAATALDELKARDLPGFLAGLRQELAPFQDEAEGVRQSWDNLMDEIIRRAPEAEGAFQELAGYIRNVAWPDISEALQGILGDYSNALDSMTELVRLKGDEGVGVVGSVLMAAAGVVGATLQIIIGLIRVGLEEISGGVKIMADIMRGDWQAAWQDLQTTTSTMGDTLKQTINGVWDEIRGAIGEENWNNIKLGWQTFWGEMQAVSDQGAAELYSTLDNASATIIGLFAAMSDEIVGHSIVPDMWAAIIEEFEVGGNEVQAIVQAWTTGLLAYLRSITPAWKQIATAWMDTFSRTIIAKLRALKAQVQAYVSSMLGILARLSGAMGGIGMATGRGFSHGLHVAISAGTRRAIQHVIRNFRGGLRIGSPSRLAIGWGEAVGEGFWIGLRRIIGGSIAGLVGNIATGLVTPGYAVQPSPAQVNQSWTWHFHSYGQGMDEDEFIRAVQVARFLAGAA